MPNYSPNLPDRCAIWLRDCLRESCVSSLSLVRYLCITPSVSRTAPVTVVFAWLVYILGGSPLRIMAVLFAVGSSAVVLIFGLTLYCGVRAALPGMPKRRNRASLRLVCRYKNRLESVPIRLTNVCRRQDMLNRLLDRTVVLVTREPQSLDSSGREAALSLYISHGEQIREYLDTPDALEESLGVLKIGNTPVKIVVCEKIASGHVYDVDTIALNVCLQQYTLHQGCNRIMLQSPQGLQKYLAKGGWVAVGEWIGPVSPDEVETMGVLWDSGRSEVYSTAEILHKAAQTL